jgi:hypothetical protein
LNSLLNARRVRWDGESVVWFLDFTVALASPKIEEHELHGLHRGWEDGADRTLTMISTLAADELWRGGLPLRHRDAIFPVDVMALQKQQAKLLVTHEAPGSTKNEFGDGGYHKHGNPALARLALAMGVSTAVHGHHHDNVKYGDGIWHGVANRNTLILDVA